MSAKKKKTIPQLLKQAEKVVNEYIRNRDSDNGYFTCISCGKVLPVEQMNAGHYVPVAKSSFLRFHEWNIHGECAGDNCFNEFHLIPYRKNLINKIGQDAVDWLEENRHIVKRWTRAELLEIIETYSLKKKAA